MKKKMNERRTWWRKCTGESACHLHRWVERIKV